MRWPRLTIRRMMGLILILAVGLGLGIPAFEVASDKGYHMHTGVQPFKGQPSYVSNGAVLSPFWPRYWRRLVGLRWRQLPVCGSSEGYLAETCHFEHPKIMEAVGDGVNSRMVRTPAQIVAYEQLEKSLKSNPVRPVPSRTAPASPQGNSPNAAPVELEPQNPDQAP